MDAHIERSLRDAQPGSFWLDAATRPAAGDPLAGATTCDLAVVGGGYSGLWTALLAKQRDPAQPAVM